MALGSLFPGSGGPVSFFNASPSLATAQVPRADPSGGTQGSLFPQEGLIVHNWRVALRELLEPCHSSGSFPGARNSMDLFRPIRRLPRTSILRETCICMLASCRRCLCFLLRESSSVMGLSPILGRRVAIPCCSPRNRSAMRL